MTKIRASVRISILSTLAVLGLVFGTSTVAQAYTATTWGELNCAGYNVYYNTTRYTQGSATIQYRLSDSAGSQYGVDATYLGVYIVAENSYKGLKYMSVPNSPNAMLSGTYWLANTAFKMYGRMPVSDGTCDNYFSGTLYY